MLRAGWIGVIFGSMMACQLAVAGEPWTLERALEQALAHNPDARLARNRIAAAQAGLEQANAAFWPRLQFQSSYTRTDNPMMVFGSILNQRAFSQSLDFNDVPDVDDWNSRGVLTIPLYTGGRNKAAKGAARANTEAAKMDSEAVRNALGFEVSRAFLTVLKTREFIRAAEAAVTSYQTNLAIAKRRLEAGALLQTDVLDLQVRLAQAQEALEMGEKGLAAALLKLALEKYPPVPATTTPPPPKKPAVRKPALPGRKPAPVRGKA